MAPAYGLSSASAPPSSPSLPRLYPADRQWLPRVTAVSQPPAWVHRPWAGGVGGGSRGKEREWGGYRQEGFRGLRREGRLEQTSDPEEEPKAKGLRTLQVTCSARDPREARGWCESVGEASPRALGQVEALHDLLGHRCLEVLSRVFAHCWKLWLGKETVAGGPKGSDGS